MLLYPLCIILCHSIMNAHARSCEDNEYEVKGVGCLPKLYRGGKTMVYMHQKKSIKTANHQALAGDCGGHLASVLSNTEQKQMDDMKISGSLLIGLTQPSSCRSEPKGCWTWDDGSTYSYSHWHSGEPNDSGNAEDCVEANWVDLNWNDLGCSASRQAVYILPTDFTKNKACEWYIEPVGKGRCGPKFGSRSCDCTGYEQYCNSDNGWCGDTAAHRDAQRGEVTWDCKKQNPLPKGRCGPKFGSRSCDCTGYELYCNSDNGWCGDTAAHRDAQRGEVTWDCKGF